MPPKRKLNVVAQGLDDIVLDPGTIAGYRSKVHRIAQFLSNNENDDKTMPNTFHPSKSKRRPKAFRMPSCEKLDKSLIGIIFDWISCDPTLARLKSKAKKGKYETETDFLARAEREKAARIDLQTLSLKAAQALFSKKGTDDGNDEDDDEDDDDEGEDDEEAGDEELDIWDQTKTIPTVSVQTMQGYKSALKAYFGIQGHSLLWTSEIDSMVERKIEGYSKRVGQKKATGVMKMVEGKAPLCFNGYIEVADALMKASPDTVRNHNFDPMSYTTA